MRAKNKQIGKIVNDGLIDLIKTTIRKKISGNENPNKIVDIVEKIIVCNKQQNSKGIKVLTPKQMLQRLPIILAQVKTGNTFENRSIYYTWTNIKKSHIRTINLKYQFGHGMNSLSQLMNNILYQMFKNILNMY